MQLTDESLDADRGCALHKALRLITVTLSGHGYLNFIGNEFGHPEWIDFPREGNDWSYAKATRLWHLRDNPKLRFAALADFDQQLISLAREANIWLLAKTYLCT